MSYVDHIIQVFGGVRKCARAIDEPPSNVSGWKQRGTIPDAKKVLLFKAARQLNLSLTPLDFLPYGLRNPSRTCESTAPGSSAQ